MFGLPNQSHEEALTDLQKAILLQPEHVSWYQLTIEPNTYFYQFPPTLPEDDALWDMQTAGQLLLKKNQYIQYEVSAYSKNEAPCLHNVNYWKFGDYLGIGAGAHSKLTYDDSVERHWNYKHPKRYLNEQTDCIEGRKKLSTREIIFEFFLNRLRMTSPVSELEFSQKTGVVFQDIEKTLSELKSRDLVTIDTHLQLTARGKSMLNDVLLAWL